MFLPLKKKEDIHHECLLTGVLLDRNKDQILSEIKERFSIEFNESGVGYQIC